MTTTDQLHAHGMGIKLDPADYARAERNGPVTVEQALREGNEAWRRDYVKLGRENAELREAVRALEMALVLVTVAVVMLVGIMAAVHSPWVQGIVRGLAGVR